MVCQFVLCVSNFDRSKNEEIFLFHKKKNIDMLINYITHGMLEQTHTRWCECLPYPYSVVGNLKLAMEENQQMLQSSNFLEGQVVNISGNNTAHSLSFRDNRVIGAAENMFPLKVAVRYSLRKILPHKNAGAASLMFQVF